MAKTVRVLPRDDGQDFQGSWQVKVSGARKSNHTTKQAAKNAARGYASDGDTLIIHRQNGTIQSRSTVRNASANSESEKKATSMPHGLGTFKTGISGAFK